VSSTSTRVAGTAIRTRQSSRVRGRSWLLVQQLAIGLGIVLVWWLVYALGWLSTDILPSPLSVLVQFVLLAGSGTFWVALLQTLATAATGLVIATVVGVALGLVLGLAPPAERATRFLLDLGRSFPVIALLPVMVLILGTRFQMEATVVFLAVFWPVLLQTIYGSRRIDPVVRDTTRAYGIRLRLRFLKVLLPAAAPFIATGVRIGASLAILVAVGIELLVRTPGLGFELGAAQSELRPDIAFAYLIYAGLLGLGVNALLERLESLVLTWNARGDVLEVQP